MNELIIPLPNGGTLRCGPGEVHEWGGYIRICDADGNEVLYWESTEWQTEGEGESVIGAAFAAALKPMSELTGNHKLVDGCWIWDTNKGRKKR